jgi:hypothetical protein
MIRFARAARPPELLPLLLFAAACTTTDAGAGPDAAPPPAPIAVRALCRELLRAPPSSWAQQLPPVLALGAPAATALVEELRADPRAVGAQAAVAALGQIGGDDVASYLCEQVRDRSDLATEAALSLGTRGDRAARELLQATADDRLTDATLRAACAASLLRLGVREPIARLVRGIVLAGTPTGQELQRELGLPDKPRWAYERYLLQRAFRQTRGDDFGLDTDSPWPDLAAVAERIDQFLSAR